MFFILIICGCTPDVTPPVIDTDSDGDSEITEEETPIVIVKELDYIAPARQGLELAYSSILEKYEEAAAGHDISNKIAAMPDLYEQDSLVLKNFKSIGSSGTDGYYSFHDINGDGIRELLISVFGTESFADLYTLDSDGQPASIYFHHGWGFAGDGMSLIHDERGNFIIEKHGDGGEYSMNVCRLSESRGKFTVLLSIGYYVNIFNNDGKWGEIIEYSRYYPESETSEIISEAQFNEFERSYSNYYTDYEWIPIKKTDHFFEKLKGVKRPDILAPNTDFRTMEELQLYKAPRVNSEIIVEIPVDRTVLGYGKTENSDPDWIFVAHFDRNTYGYVYGWVNTKFLEPDNKEDQ